MVPHLKDGLHLGNIRGRSETSDALIIYTPKRSVKQNKQQFVWSSQIRLFESLDEALGKSKRIGP